MLFKVKVVDKAAYDEHIAALAENADNVGPAIGGTEVNQQPGLEQNGASE
jgi:hypothetical protein